MGLFGLYLALGAASVGGQAVQPPAATNSEAAFPVTFVTVTPVVYQLPVQSRLQAVPPKAGLRQSAALQEIVPPPMPRDPFETPSAPLWPSNSPIRMNLVGVKLGWTL